MTGRTGTSVVEALVALLLGLFLLHAGMRVVVAVRAHHERLVARSEGLAAVRLTGALLRMEVSTAMPGPDWAVSEDGIALRAFRGTGLICGARSAPDVLVVAFSGYRRPDPAKDSVLLVYPQGARHAVALRGAGGVSDTTCAGAVMVDAVELRLTEPVAPGAVVARVFERGTYALTGRALRYRRGAGGRQPLTPELWTASTGWRHHGRRIGAELALEGGASPLRPGAARGRRWQVPIGVIDP